MQKTNKLQDEQAFSVPDTPSEAINSLDLQVARKVEMVSTFGTSQNSGSYKK